MRTLFLALFVLAIFLASTMSPELAAAGGQSNGVPVKDGKVALAGDNTQIKFVGSKAQGKHDGGFKTFTGTLELNEKGAPKSLNLEIETASIFTDTGKLTNHLKTKDFFDVAKFPKAMFASTKIEPAAKDAKDATHQVTGKLTLHGETKEISFPISVKSGNDGLSGTSKFEIDRQDFGMTYGKGIVHDKVSITVTVGKSGK
jgi:polyisoprenoid-binding protein YceI